MVPAKGEGIGNGDIQFGNERRCAHRAAICIVYHRRVGVAIDKDVVEGRKDPIRVYAEKEKTGDAA